MSEQSNAPHLTVEITPREPTIVLSWGDRMATITYLTDDTSHIGADLANGQTLLARRLMADRLRFWAQQMDHVGVGIVFPKTEGQS